MNLYTQETNTTVRCDSEFYDFYYHAKIGELVVLMPYAAYIIFSLVFMMSVQSMLLFIFAYPAFIKCSNHCDS